MRRLLFSWARVLASIALASCVHRPSVRVADGMPPLPRVESPRVIVTETYSGRVLYEKDADVRCAVASTQKLLTALVALEDGGLDRQVTVAADDVRTQPRVAPLRPGEVLTRRQLLALVLLESANDAAKALARDVAGGRREFADRMNRKAARLGMTRSSFANAHGLTVKRQHSTARDLATLAAACKRQPVIAELCGARLVEVTPACGKSRRISNGNPLLARPGSCDGLKCGYTRAAGRCVVATGYRGGRHLTVVITGGTEPEIWDEVGRLFEWGADAPPIWKGKIAGTWRYRTRKEAGGETRPGPAAREPTGSTAGSVAISRSFMGG